MRPSLYIFKKYYGDYMEETMAKIFCEMLDMVINGFPDDEDFEKLMETIKNS